MPPLPSEHGAILLATGVQIASTLKCPHCGLHFNPQHQRFNSRGKLEQLIPGFCRKCMRATCGDDHCEACIPEELMLELIEAKVQFWQQYERVQ